MTCVIQRRRFVLKRCAGFHHMSESSVAQKDTTQPESERKKAPALVEKLPLLSVRAGPRDDPQLWVKRLQQEFGALIQLVTLNKAHDTEWFNIQAEDNTNGTRWSGKVWFIYKYKRYEFSCSFELGPTYPTSPPEFLIPEVEGKTAKMYRGGKICMTDHFYPLWARNVPKFGIAHLLCLGVAPWLQVEVPQMADAGLIEPASSANST